MTTKTHKTTTETQNSYKKDTKYTQNNTKTAGITTKDTVSINL